MDKTIKAFEGITVSMRFILPVLMSLFLYNYTQDQQMIANDEANATTNSDNAT